MVGARVDRQRHVPVGRPRQPRQAGCRRPLHLRADGARRRRQRILLRAARLQRRYARSDGLSADRRDALFPERRRDPGYGGDRSRALGHRQHRVVTARDRRRRRHRLVSRSRSDSDRALRVDRPGRRRHRVSGRRLLGSARGALRQRIRRGRRRRTDHARCDVSDDRGEHGRPAVLAGRRRRQGRAAHRAGIEQRGDMGGSLHRPGGCGGRHRELAGPGGRLPLERHGRSGDARGGRDLPVRGHGHGRGRQQRYRGSAGHTPGHASDRGRRRRRGSQPDRRRRHLLAQC